jgi:ATP-dependent protease HslVU (ClpYQ) peptidase subunit
VTTVAWDGQTLAADRLITEGGHVAAHVVKIRRCADGRLIGAAGELDAITALLDWLEAGGDRPAFLANKQAAEALEITPRGQVWNHLQYGRTLLVPGPQAIGSGAPYARAAMALGASADKAVRIAAQFDTCTGGRVDALALAPKARKTPRRRRKPASRGG